MATPKPAVRLPMMGRSARLLEFPTQGLCSSPASPLPGHRDSFPCSPCHTLGKVDLSHELGEEPGCRGRLLRSSAGKGEGVVKDFPSPVSMGGGRVGGLGAPQIVEGDAGCADLCLGTIKPGWTSPPNASLPATRPVPSGPSLGQTPRRRSVFHRGNAFSPRWGWGGRRGAGCPGAHPHKARGDAEDTLAGGRLPAGWRGQRARRGRKRGPGGADAAGGAGPERPTSEPRTPDVRPGRFWFTSTSPSITFWSADSGAE